MEGPAMKTMSKMMTIKMMSILCLMMILPGGLASPVAGEGDSGLDFVSGFVDSAFSWFIPESVSNETDVFLELDDDMPFEYEYDEYDNATNVTAGVEIAKVMDNQAAVKFVPIETVGSLGSGRAFVADSVDNLGFVNGVEEESLCCEECHKEHPSAEYYDFIYQSSKSIATTSCTCKKSKPSVRPRTSEVGISSGQCGSWVYRGDGPLGDGVYFESGVGEMGDMTNVNESSKCCKECSRRFPGTTMFTFINKINKCQCYGLQRGQTPVTRMANFSTGACEPKSPATDIESATEAAKPKVEMENLMMNDAPAAVSGAFTNQEVEGELGDGKIFNPNTMNLVNYVYASGSGECCDKCQDLQQDARFFIFSKENPQCACLTSIDGVKPATMDPGSGYKNWMPNPVAGVCGRDESNKEVQLGDLMMGDAPADVSNQGSVAGGIGDGRTLDRDTVTWLQHVPGDSSEECCKRCQGVSPEATLYVFSKGHHQCACFTPKEGVQPATTQPDYWIPEPVTGVCV